MIFGSNEMLKEIVEGKQPSDKVILEVLQFLADKKIASYEAKWSKASEDHIEVLKRDYDDVNKLIKYFTKR